MSKFIAYLRVSSDRQGRSGLGLEAQEALVRRHVADVSGELLDVIVEVESGSVDHRPGLARALADCRRRKATLLIARLDRLGRRLSFLAALLEADVELRVADNPGATKLTLQLLAVVAEAERDLIRQRTREALQAAKARGVQLGIHGRRLAALATDRAVEFDRAHRQVIDQIRASGAKTVREFAAGLNARNIPSPAGGSWGPGNCARLLNRLAHAGCFTSSSSLGATALEPSEDLHRTAEPGRPQDR